MTPAELLQFAHDHSDEYILIYRDQVLCHGTSREAVTFAWNAAEDHGLPSGDLTVLWPRGAVRVGSSRKTVMDQNYSELIVSSPESNDSRDITLSVRTANNQLHHHIRIASDIGSEQAEQMMKEFGAALFNFRRDGASMLRLEVTGCGLNGPELFVRLPDGTPAEVIVPPHCVEVFQSALERGRRKPRPKNAWERITDES